MYLAYDSAFGGRGAEDTIKPSKPPRERRSSERDSINSSSSSEKTSSSRTPSVSSASARSPSEKSTFSGFSFGLAKKASKSQLHLKLPSFHKPHRRDSEDLGRLPVSRDGKASPLPITPPEPTSAQVIHEVAHSDISTKATELVHSATSLPASPGSSVERSFDNLSVRTGRASKAVSFDSVDRYAPSVWWG
jgi:hypothetical protein